MNPLREKNVALVVTGGIAAYKTAELARLLIKEGARVRTAMTEAAARFITPLTFETLTQAPVATDLWTSRTEVGHIALADWAQAVVIAPATANIIGKMSAGLADDFVSTFLLAVRAPIIVCPSMNVNMYDHPVVQENLKKLRSIGLRVVEPEQGFLACGWEGKGRLPEPDAIVEEVKRVLSVQDLAGRRVTVTAGPTREPWDDIRFLSNRSTGLMGLCLARTAWRRGAEVLLITGPIAYAPPYGCGTVQVETTRQMLAVVRDNLDRTDILVKAAAPSDFRPAAAVAGKVKKTTLPPPLELAQNPDILKTINPDKGDRIFVGFAAESSNLIESARDKLQAKGLDLIVANQIGPSDQSFGAATNQVWIIDRRGQVEEIPLQSKEDVADCIWDRVADLLRRRN
ncbi:MAG: bifunctional phosphopantothenoylcysteine decarboxylase/phosphopantothenate--cysteine ligase CoaBC [Thermodesulfobacteriota bacterium]